jgi:lysophospholipase L1-like esterase
MNSDRIYLGLVPLLRGTARSARRKRAEGFASEQVAPRNVVFLGDSITERGDWGEWFPDLGAVNRGIGWDTSEDVLARLDGAIRDPVAVSLLVGTNDLHASRHLADLDGIARRVNQIVTKIQSEAPSAEIFVNAVMPRTTYFAPRIRALNEHYRAIANQRGCTFVDTWELLADDAGAIRKIFTIDNLHVSPSGYEAWCAGLRPLLSPFGA